MNLLIETIAALNTHSKTQTEVCFVSDGNFSCPWSDFAMQASNVTRFKNEFDSSDVNPKLIVAGADWWLSRNTDNSGWTFNQQPKRMPIGAMKLEVYSY